MKIKCPNCQKTHEYGPPLLLEWGEESGVISCNSCQKLLAINHQGLTDRFPNEPQWPNQQLRLSEKEQKAAICATEILLEVVEKKKELQTITQHLKRNIMKLRQAITSGSLNSKERSQLGKITWNVIASLRQKGTNEENDHPEMVQTLDPEDFKMLLKALRGSIQA